VVSDAITTAEAEKPVLINLRVTRPWREFAHDTARQHGMNLSQFIVKLVEDAAWKKVESERRG